MDSDDICITILQFLPQKRGWARDVMLTCKRLLNLGRRVFHAHRVGIKRAALKNNTHCIEYVVKNCKIYSKYSLKVHVTYEKWRMLGSFKYDDMDKRTREEKRKMRTTTLYLNEDDFVEAFVTACGSGSYECVSLMMPLVHEILQIQQFHKISFPCRTSNLCVICKIVIKSLSTACKRSKWRVASQLIKSFEYHSDYVKFKLTRALIRGCINAEFVETALGQITINECEDLSIMLSEHGRKEGERLVLSIMNNYLSVWKI